MKKLFKSFVSAGICLAAAMLISCKDDDGEIKVHFDDFDMGIANVEIPEWSVNPEGAEDLPALIFDGSASNVNKQIKEAVKKAPAKINVKNVVFMFFDGLTEDLIESTDKKFYEDLILNDLSVKMTFTAPAFDENADETKVVGKLLSEAPYYKACSYVTSASVANDVFRQFRNTKLSSDTERNRVYEIVCGAKRPSFMLAKDTESAMSVAFSSDLNDFWKSDVKFVTNFKDAVACYGQDDPTIEIPGEEGHPTKYDTTEQIKGLFSIYPYNATEYPSPVQSMAFALTFTEIKSPAEGFFVVFYDDAKGENKQSELKNFDEAVVAASKYVLENPDTILVVTSAALDGSSIPAFALGNIPDSAKSANTLVDFVKAAVPAE